MKQTAEQRTASFNTTEKIKDRLCEVSGRIADLQVEFLYLKDKLRELGPSKDDQVTVYKVRKTFVSGYTRRGFMAVRMNNGGHLRVPRRPKKGI